MIADFAAAGQGDADAILRVDGGMAVSDWTMQFLADIVDAPVDRLTYRETTALGAAFLAGWRAGVYPAPDDLYQFWRADRRFVPSMSAETRQRRFAGWRAAVACTLLERETLK